MNILWTVLVLGALPAASGEAPQEASAADRAITRGIEYLMSKQAPDGSIHDPAFPVSTASTSLSILSMLAVGHQPGDQTPEGAALRKALAFVLAPERQDAQGYFGCDGSAMYGHGITTLMLAEMLGMGVDEEQDQLIRASLRRAVDLILRTQAVRRTDPKMQGGWRYAPEALDEDMSITIWQVMALRAAKNADLEVPDKAIADAVAVIKRHYVPKGGFAYQQGPQNPSTFPMASAGLLALQMCGEYDAPEVKATADLLQAQRLKYDSPWFLYGAYYYSQGMYQRGGAYAEESAKKLEDAIVPKQAKDGSWTPQVEPVYGKVYATAMAILSLAVKAHYLPIYQR